MAQTRSLSEKIAFVFEVIQAAGVAISPGSRFDRMRRVFLDSNGQAIQTVLPHDPEFGAAKEALREFSLLEAIFEAAKGTSLLDDRRVLKRLCKDAVSPSKAGNTPGRDLQTELLVAATCALGGFSDVLLDEPDVTAILGETKWGIAVKRVKSAAAISDNVRDAAEQIRKSGLPGMVFLDVSVAFNPHGDDITRPLSPAQFTSSFGYAMRKLLEPQVASLRARASSRGIGVIYSFFSCLRHDPRGGWGLATMHMDVLVREDDDPDRQLFEFRAAYDRGIKALTPSSA